MVLPGAGSWLVLCAALASMAGCTSQSTRHFGHTARAVAVPETPFYPQERYQCGPAALLTILEHSGADATLEALVQSVYLPGREGSLQPELIAATRASGRLPYPISGTLDAIAAEIDAGRPVLVLQNLGVSWFPRWHYAVVYRVDPPDDSVWLRSGTDPERRTAAGTFARTWRRADNWGIVALEPGDLPANPDADRYFLAVAGLEETGHVLEAREAWLAAADRWPDRYLPLFGAGNAELALGNFAFAERYYRTLLARWPAQTMVRNNLAIAQARQGRTAAAVKTLEEALDEPGLAPTLVEALQDTLAEVSLQTN